MSFTLAWFTDIYSAVFSGMPWVGLVPFPRSPIPRHSMAKNDNKDSMILIISDICYKCKNTAVRLHHGYFLVSRSSFSLFLLFSHSQTQATSLYFGC